MLKRFSAALLLIALVACGSTEAEVTQPAVEHKPLLWKVSDADNAIYLMGSFHLLKAEDYPLAPSAYAALEDSAKVVFELSPAEMNDPSLGQRMAQAAMRTDGQTLQQSLPAETWASLETYAAKRGLPIANLQGFKGWFVSLLISITEMQLAGLNPEFGLDKHFAERAVAAGKQVEGLETGDQQIALFNGMTDAQQLQALQETLDGLDGMEAEIATMHALWRSGDADGLYAATGAEMKAEYPDLYQRVNADRNLAWLPRLQAMLDDSDGDNTLVVVGALHLLEQDGVVELLRAKGYTVERL
jgi:uncharacterized protein YbaP (TraB family)